MKTSARHISRYALLALAARREIEAPNAARVDELLVAACAALADTGAWSAARLVREQRASH